MKALINGIILFTMWFVIRSAQAQGTLYVSNLTQPSTNSMAVAGDSWIAQLFLTGTNPGGYTLNAIQLLMNSDSGNPSGFTISVYTPSNAIPGTYLGNLVGPSNPSTKGIFSYSASGIMLSPLTSYFIVVTASTPISNGAYYWSLANTGLDTTFGDTRWAIYQLYGTSSNGQNWAETAGQNNFQMAIYATAVPEPSALWLIFLGSGVFIYVRRAFHR